MSRSAKVASGRKRAERESRRKSALRKKRLRTIVIIAAAVAALIAVAVVTWPEPDVGSTTAEGWDLPALEGDARYALSSYSGRPTVAAFFASWCTVCEREIPEFLELSRQLEDEVTFVGINSQDGGRGMGDAEKWGLVGAWPLARDIGGRNGSGLSVGTFGARGMPLTVIYSPEGKVAHVQRGGVSAQGLAAILNDLFGV